MRLILLLIGLIESQKYRQFGKKAYNNGKSHQENFKNYRNNQGNYPNSYSNSPKTGKYGQLPLKPKSASELSKLAPPAKFAALAQQSAKYGKKFGQSKFAAQFGKFGGKSAANQQNMAKSMKFGKFGGKNPGKLTQNYMKQGAKTQNPKASKMGKKFSPKMIQTTGSRQNF